tara:strand:+ start:387 stop:578 length:192 start_codon:yes stop_codon:yes gene_type:complete
MGNLLLKSKNKNNIINNDLYKPLLRQDYKDLLERINYLENKIDDLDAIVWSLESKYKYYFKNN